MTPLREGDLEFDFAGAISASKFDGPKHGLSHCMKAVDFIVEFPRFRLFVEVKDPDSTEAPVERRAKFAEELCTPKLTDSLTRKFRDSWLYHWATGMDSKRTLYVVLLQLASLQRPALQSLGDNLRRHLPEAGPPSWKRRLVDAVLVMDISSWNQEGTFGTVRRI